MNGEQKFLMDVREMSRHLAMPIPTIYSYVSLGKIPSECVVRIGRTLKFKAAEMEAWAERVNGKPLTSQRPVQADRQSAR